MLRILGNSADLREGREARGQLLVGGDGVGHGAVVEGFVGVEIEIASAGEAEEDRLFFACFLAFERFVDGGADGVAGLGRGNDSSLCSTKLSILLDAGI